MKYIIIMSFFILYSCSITRPRIKNKFLLRKIENINYLESYNDTLYLLFDSYNSKNYKKVYFNQFSKGKLNKTIEFSFGDFQNNTEIIHYKESFSKYKFDGKLKVTRKPGYSELILTDIGYFLKDRKIINSKALSGFSKREVFDFFNGKFIYVIEPQLNGFFKIYEATQNLQMVTIP